MHQGEIINDLKVFPPSTIRPKRVSATIVCNPLSAAVEWAAWQDLNF